MKTGKPRTDAKVLTVRCPGCSGPSRYMADNPWRPFCSERCKQLDLGAWASESYRMPAESPPEELDNLPPRDDA
ncbi:MAG: DNA gyrase inhibitor YacG [Burkholderiales bacterium]